MAKAEDDSVEIMRFGSASGNVAGNDEHEGDYTVDFAGSPDAGSFHGFESGGWAFFAEDAPQGTDSVGYTISDSEGSSGGRLEVKVEGSPLGSEPPPSLPEPEPEPSEGPPAQSVFNNLIGATYHG